MKSKAGYCRMPKRNLPVLREVDFIVAGATLGGLSAALKAATLGARVFVIGYMPYMGEDICGTCKYLFDEHTGDHPLLKQLFPEDGDRTPFHIKKVLENQLIDHNVDFLYSSMVTEVLFEDPSTPNGVVIANRSGQQILRGKVILDATPGASVARLAGARFHEEKSGKPQPFQFITVGNTTDPTRNKRTLPVSPEKGNAAMSANEYTFVRQPEDWSYPSLCSIEQDIRGRVWDPDQVDAADHLFYLPPYHIEGLSSDPNHRSDTSHASSDINHASNASDASDINHADHLLPPEGPSLNAFVPANRKRMYVLGGCADISRTAASELLKPEHLILAGERIGEAAANAVKKIRLSPDTSLGKGKESPSMEGTLRIGAAPIRPEMTKKRIKLNPAVVPVIGEYDTVILGGGTVGANAGISAARNGARTLVVEYLHGLGGLETMGRIGAYWDGYREGFTKEIDKGVREMAPANHPRQNIKDGHSNADWKMEWYRREIRKAGGDIWFGALGFGALVEDGRVKGVLIATPQGPGVVLSHIIVDSTGSGDIAIAAGAAYEYTDKNHFAIQGAGLPPVNPGDHYINTDWTFIDDSDICDVTRLYVSGKAMFDQVYDIGKLPQTRERRRIVADHMVSVLDVLNHRRYPDTISFHTSSFDTHGYTIHPYFTICPPKKRHVLYDADVPLRSLLPRGLDNILVTGLGAGAQRDAMPVIRMQPCLQNQGYSVGYLCALSVRENRSVRNADIKKVQKHLVAKGILPERVLTDVDNFPFSDHQLKEAVSKLTGDYHGLEVLLTNPQKAEQLLLEAYNQANKEEEKLIYAQILCMLGNDAGMQTVLDSVRKEPGWDEGWDYTGMGQFGPCMSNLDSRIIALGETKREAALPAILEKAEKLTPKHAFSHFRAVTLACESIGSPAAAETLSKLLDGKGIMGHQVTDLKHAREDVVPAKVDVSIRNQVLREICLAGALYQCGDDEKKGERILRNYSSDLHGTYFRYASELLDNGNSKNKGNGILS